MTTTIQFRVDTKTKKQAQKLYSDMGMDLSSALNLFLKQSLIEEALPFKPKRTPDQIRAEWDREMEEVMKNRKHYKSAAEAHASILKKK